MLKKVILAAFILAGSTLGAFSFSSDASAKHVNGNITWYNGVGKKALQVRNLDIGIVRPRSDLTFLKTERKSELMQKRNLKR